MDIQRCFEILELDRGAQLDEAKQAYKDIVNVWHPDRFLNNPRLKEKAEEKLKEVNVAYETVKFFLSGKQEVKPDQKADPQAQAKAEAEYYKAQAEPQARDKTEVIVEAGTRIILDVCSSLYKTLRRIVVSQASKAEPQAKVESRGLKQGEWQSRGDCRGKGRGRGTGKGRGMGRGGGMGRGRG
ncbi:MAG: J domain-containing protein [Desulfobacterales bacterium]|nr:J domain-containing protein [Desulfobacterales bacterium]